MGSILVIERRPILREALRQFLFPEHRTTVRDRWPGEEDVRGHDLVIVDRESLEEGGAEVPEVLRALRSLGVPCVWLHLGAAPVPDSDGLARTVSKPLERASLEAALGSLLPAPSAAPEPPGDEPPEAAPEGDGQDPGALARPSEERGAPEGDEPGIIELTDVVEEEAVEEDAAGGTGPGTPGFRGGGRG